jgi:hypothetical protein
MYTEFSFQMAMAQIEQKFGQVEEISQSPQRLDPQERRRTQTVDNSGTAVQMLTREPVKFELQTLPEARVPQSRQIMESA